MKQTFVKDFHVGLLLIVISLFFTMAAYKLAGEPSFWTFLGIYLSIIIGENILKFGLDLIRGLYLVTDEKE